MRVLDRFSLRGRVALVTGGSGPLFGGAISEGLAEAGATVVAASRSLERNHEFASRLRADGLDAHAARLDIGDPASIEACQRDLLQRFGRVDVLVNSAIHYEGLAGGLEEQDPEVWLRSAAGDMSGLMRICRAFLPGMRAQGRGSIINVASIYGVVGNDPSLYADTTMRPPVHYPFIKGGMIAFTRYLAAAVGKAGVRVNCLSPGGLANAQPEPFMRRYCERVPIGRMLDHDDIKGAAVFLASDASGYVTGTNLMVDGGWTCI
jgi:NAD(P)-dependent dehydrogenase (short-subunit alcohol dehydrogenase family)